MKTISRLAFVLLLAAVAKPSQAAVLTYELRATGVTGTGATLLGDKGVMLAPGQDATVTMDIFALVLNSDGNHANDGIQSGYLSFQSLALTGVGAPPNLKGYMNPAANPAAPNTTVLPVFQVPPWTTGGVQDIDGDGDLDVGSTSGDDTPSFFYHYQSGLSAFDLGSYVYGTGTGTGTGLAEIKIGTLTVRFGAADVIGGAATNLRAIPRTWAHPPPMHYWVQDGVSQTEMSAGAEVASGADVRVDVLAISNTWTGGGLDDLWTNGANWGGTAPDPWPILTFGPATKATNHNDLSPDTPFSGINFTSDAAVYQLQGNRIALGGAIVNESPLPQTIGLDLLLSASGVNVNATAGDVVISGSVSGPGPLAKLGAGTLVLTGANSYSGGTNFNGGLIEAGTLENLGSAGQFLFNGGGLRWTAGSSFDPSVRGMVFSGAAVLDTNGNDAVLSKAISGAGGLTKAGSGTLTLGAANTFSGATRVATGTLRLSHASALQNSTLDMNATDSGTVDFSGTSFTLGGLSGMRDLAIPASCALSIGNNAASTAYSGVLSGNGATLTKIGGGTLTLAGANTFSGVTRVKVGSLQLTNALALQNSTLDMNSADAGTVGLDSLNAMLGGLSGSRSLALPANKTTAIGNNNASTTYSGVLTGTGANLTKIGSGTLTLGGVNTFSGTTRIGGGTLTLSNALALRSSTVDLNDLDAGTLDLGSSSATLGGLMGTRSLAIPDNQTLSVGYNGASTTYSGVLSGAGAVLRKLGSGTLTLQGTNTYTGPTYISAGMIEAGSLANLGNGTALNFGGGGLQWAAGSSFDPSIRNMVFNGTATLDTNGNNVTLANPVSGTGGLTKTGSGTLALGSASTLSGNTRITTGTLQTVNPLALQKSTLDMNSSDAGVVDFLGQSATLGGLTGSRNLMVPDSQTLSVGNNNSSTTYSGILSGTGAGLTKIGSATLTLGGANTFGGTTRVAAGTLTVTNSLALQNSTVDLNATDTGALSLSGLTAATLGGLSGSRNWAIGSSKTLSVGNNNSATTYSGILSGTGANLTKVGTGTLTLGGINTFTGTTRIAGGTLRLVEPLALRTSTVNLSSLDAGTLDLDSLSATLGGLTGSRSLTIPDGRTLSVGYTNSTTDYSGVLSGSGAGLTKIGSGTLYLSGASTFNGTTRIAAGTLRPTHSLALQNSTVDLNTADSGSLSLSGLTAATLGGLTGSRNLAIPASAVLSVGNNNADTSYSGVLSGANATLTKNGTGILTISGNNTYTGSTSVNLGKLLVDGNHTGGGIYSVAADATLGGRGSIASEVDLLAGGHLAPGSSGPGTLVIASLLMNSSAAMDYELDQAQLLGGGTNDLLDVHGDATLDGLINVSGLSQFGPGRYTLLTYRGTLTDRGIHLGTVPSFTCPSYSYALEFVPPQESSPGNMGSGSMNLVVTIVPEATTCALLGSVTLFLVSLAAMAFMRRQRTALDE